MNFNVAESNPIMSRFKSQKTLANTAEQYKNNESEKKEELKPKIYKPPLRSSSMARTNRNESETTTSTSSSSYQVNENVAEFNKRGSTINALTTLTALSNTKQGKNITSNTGITGNLGFPPSGINKNDMPFSSATYKPTTNRNNIKRSIFKDNEIVDRTSEANNFDVNKNSSTYNDKYKGFNYNNSLSDLQTKLLANNSKNQNNASRSVVSNRNVSQILPQNSAQNNYQVNSTNQQNYVINLEDLIMLEEKLGEVIFNLNRNLPVMNECFEWWNFYFNCSLCGKLEYYFKEEGSKIVIKDYTILELLTIIICYDSSHDKQLYSNIQVMLKSVLALLHHNFLIVSEYILGKISSESENNIWVQKLRYLVENKMPIYNPEFNYQFKNKTTMYFSSQIKSNNSSIYDYMRITLKNYSQHNEITDMLITYFKNVSKTNINILNEFFRSKVMRVINKNASVLASVLINANENNYDKIPVPYLKKESLKELTLVLDLDETLIHFKIDHIDENKGLLRLRPGLFEFLDAVSAFYELIVFTAATQEYADPILDAIEQDRIYFDYRLYRQHAVIFENDFVKDISKLGRNLSKIIIVDNMPQNFRLQKENGIFIRTFYGEDSEDTALLDLIPILSKIALDKVKDVRVSLMKFRDEILKKISSNIEKQTFFSNYKI